MHSAILTNTTYKISLRINKSCLSTSDSNEPSQKKSPPPSNLMVHHCIFLNSPHLHIYYSSTKTPTLLLSYSKSLNSMWSLLFKFFDKHLTCRFRFPPVSYTTYLSQFSLVNQPKIINLHLIVSSFLLLCLWQVLISLVIKHLPS